MPDMKEFAFRRLNGVTDIRLSDDPVLRAEVCSSMPKLAPLLEEHAGRPEPTFESLKSTREALDFLSTDEGRSCAVRLRVIGRGGSVVEKAVLFMDGHDSVRASSKWTEDGGIRFSRS